MSEMNTRLVEFAALAHEFFAPFTGLPELAVINLDAMAGSIREIDAQLYEPADERAVAQWAAELGAAVRFTARQNYVECSTVTDFHGVRVCVWTHVTHDDATRVLSALGSELEPNKPALVDASALLHAPTVTEAAVA